MGRSPFVPVALRKAPFTLAAARRYGVTEDHLRGSAWRRLGRGVFAWHGIAEEPLVRLQAAMHRLPSDAVFSG
ncbi:MAG TPA: hypothetical protein VLK88_12420, partial [Gemmatimonadales bacterium]|nr:hypothetical protein [Gemmatimonadales bacterium]